MTLHISLVHNFEQQQDSTEILAFSRDGKQLVSSDYKALYLWQLTDAGHWEFANFYPYGAGPINFAGFFPHGAGPIDFASDVACYRAGEVIKLISFTGQEIATFPYPASRWEITPDLRWIVSNEQQDTLRVTDRLSRKSFLVQIPFPPKNLEDHERERVWRFLFTPDGRQVVLWADSPEGALHICAFDPEHQHLALQKTLPGMMDEAISPDGKLFAVILSIVSGEYKVGTQEIYLYDLRSFQLLHVFKQTRDLYNKVTFSPDSRYLMSSVIDGSVDIFSLETYDCVAHFVSHPGLNDSVNDPIGGLAWSRTGYLATGGASVYLEDMNKPDYSMKIWKVEEE